MAHKLTVELVPSSAWGNNLRRLLTSAEWDRVRRGIYGLYRYRCAVCGAGGRMHCHEVWRYDDARRVQQLVDLVALCEWCHHVKHLGHASVLAAEGKLDYGRVVEHFMRVNGCTLEAFDLARNQAFEVWERRSRFRWRLELGELVGEETNRECVA
jgi:hypothetical protein